jgi:serine/threonine-protein kinase
VPKVVGSGFVKAKATLEKAGFEVERRSTESEARPGRVVSQDPAAGRKADEGSTVTLTVSTGPGRQLVPSVVSLPAQQAQRELNAAGFKVTQDVIPSTTIEDGLAIRTSPKEGTFAPKGSDVRLFISSGPPPVTVPSVVGQDKDDARATLEDAGLQVTTQPAESQEPKDRVIAQDPEGGVEVDRGSRITLTVSEGPQRVQVPAVIGDDVDSATATLEGAGFRVRTREEESDEPEGTVIGQSPDAGARALEGSTVTLTVAIPLAGGGGGTPAPPDDGGPDPGEGEQFSTEQAP